MSVRMPAAFGAVAVAVAVVSAGGASTAANDAFGGLWRSTDIDGSRQQLAISLSAAGTYFVSYEDEKAGVCANGRVYGSGLASAAGSKLSGTLDLTCESKQQFPGVGLTLTYHAAAGTLVDGLGVTWSHEPAAPAVKGLQGRIAYFSNRSGDYEIWTMNADGSGQKRLTTSPGADVVPRWSPDGGRIVFESTRDQNDSEVYVMNAGGSGQSRLTDNAVDDWGPVWSPDGSRIAWSTAGVHPGSDFDVWVMNADGSGKKDLTPGPGRDFAPDWSPDGKRIVFASDDDGDYDLYSIAPDGSGLAKLFDGDADVGSPRWSPDGERVAFTGFDLFTGEPDIAFWAGGPAIGRLTVDVAWDCCATWSPDGTWLLFGTERQTGELDMLVMRPDGSGTRALLAGDGSDVPGDWIAAKATAAACTISGTNGPDKLVGTPKADVICGLGGNDVLKGWRGNDVLKGGAGADRLVGGDGNDRLEGGPGADAGNGGPGKDVCATEKRWRCEK